MLKEAGRIKNMNRDLKTDNVKTEKVLLQIIKNILISN